VVAVASGLDNRTPRPALVAEVEEAQKALRQGWGYPNPQSHPQVAAWRQAFKTVGVSVKKHQSSIEALCRRVLAGSDLPCINPLVDFYNLVSLRHVVPAGGWDIAELAGGRVVLRLSRGGESFQELGQENAIEVGEGEVTYLDDRGVVTRHFVWRQSDRAKVAPGTSDLLLVSEILPELDDAVAEEVENDFVVGLAEHFGSTARSAILGEETEEWSFSA
jgi:DNA/RNA-binding domain of Phe-tRNA-synthetase-like protein